jgi:hypothetical protein
MVKKGGGKKKASGKSKEAPTAAGDGVRPSEAACGTVT